MGLFTLGHNLRINRIYVGMKPAENWGLTFWRFDPKIYIDRELSLFAKYRENEVGELNMAIRLRTINGVPVALCAAKTVSVQGDIYIDDAFHYAISQKYWRDYEEIDIVDKEHSRLVASIELEDN